MPGPIALNDPASLPRWSRKLLGFLWLYQLCITGIYQLLILTLLLLVFKAGLEQFPIAFTVSTIVIFISNAAILFCILYELTYLGAIAQLTPHRYYRVQLVKSLYFVAVILLIVLSGTGTPMTGYKRGREKVWGDIWRYGTLVFPFWTALVYAVVMRKKNARPFGDEDVGLMTLLW